MANLASGICGRPSPRAINLIARIVVKLLCLSRRRILPAHEIDRWLSAASTLWVCRYHPQSCNRQKLVGAEMKRAYA